jgi:hypothetical protein
MGSFNLVAQVCIRRKKSVEGGISKKGKAFGYGIPDSTAVQNVNGFQSKNPLFFADAVLFVGGRPVMMKIVTCSKKKKIELRMGIWASASRNSGGLSLSLKSTFLLACNFISQVSNSSERNAQTRL